MQNIDFKNVKKIHFIGVGGVSMSALAKLAKDKGIVVSGSDCRATEALRQLKKQKVKVFTKHKAKNVLGADLVVYSSAISKDNIEINKAKELNIPIIERAKFLGEIAKEYKTVVSVSGMHGKTTTTAMISNCFLRFGLNPTIHLGGNFPLISGNLYIGGKDFFITEACEFKDSFLTLSSTVSVITNIEREHLDYFKNFKNIKNSFNKFVKNTKEICFVNYAYLKYIEDKRKVVTFGFNKNADFYARKIKTDKGCYSFDCFKKSEFLGRVTLNIEGRHSILNALAMICVCSYFSIPTRDIFSSLKQFKNVDRRFEKLGKFNGADVIFDYAHHPTEIKKTISTCLNKTKNPVVCVFQPHTYSRTKSLIKNFCSAFLGVESLILVETYSAREKYDFLGSCENLKETIEKECKNIKTYGVFSKKQVVGFLRSYDLKDKTLLFLGAGDIEDAVKKFKTKFIT